MANHPTGPGADLPSVEAALAGLATAALLWSQTGIPAFALTLAMGAALIFAALATCPHARLAAPAGWALGGILLAMPGLCGCINVAIAGTLAGMLSLTLHLARQPAPVSQRRGPEGQLYRVITPDERGPLPPGAYWRREDGELFTIDGRWLP